MSLDAFDEHAYSRLMQKHYAETVCVVAAIGDGMPEYWIAAVPREEALEVVRAKVNPDRKLLLTDRRLTPAQIARLKMQPGTLRRVKSVP
jgi:hypothetical protein